MRTGPVTLLLPLSRGVMVAMSGMGSLPYQFDGVPPTDPSPAQHPGVQPRVFDVHLLRHTTEDAVLEVARDRLAGAGVVGYLDLDGPDPQPVAGVNLAHVNSLKRDVFAHATRYHRVALGLEPL